MAADNRNFSKHIGIGISPKYAENARSILYKADLLVRNRKVIKIENLIFFPILKTEGVAQLLKDIPYKIDSFEFPERFKKKNLHETLKKEFPKYDWDNISLKYDQIGKIAILKMDPIKIPYQVRKRVAQEILSQKPKLKSVVNKLDNVFGVERVYPQELLAGKMITHTWHKEFDISIFVDLERAYFNPRLAEEHHRIATSIYPNDRILDLFTGVGSFSLHCAKEVDCHVVAIDINPFAIEALSKSIKKNKLRGTIYPIIGDSCNILQKKRHFDHVIINLPEKSIDILSYASNLVKKGGIISLFQFIRKIDDPITQIRHLISNQLTNANSYKETYIKLGREVSPSKVQFNIDLEIL